MGLSMKLIAPLETQDYEQQYNTDFLQKCYKIITTVNIF